MSSEEAPPIALAGLGDRLRVNKGNRILTREGNGWRERTFVEVAADLDLMRDGLLEAGLTAGVLVGVLAETRYEWIVLDCALLAIGAVSVPLMHDSQNLGIDIAKIEDCRLEVLITADQVLDAFTGECVVLDLETVARGPEAVRASGAARLPLEPHAHELAAADVFTVVESSGTTGTPKQIAMCRSGAERMLAAYASAYDFSHDDRLIVALPLSIYQQRHLVYVALAFGCDLVITDAARLLRTLRETAPTLLVAPPTLYRAAELQIARRGRALRWLITASECLRRVLRSERLWKRVSRLIFRQAHAAFGGRMRVMLTGSAPTPLSTLQLFRTVGLPLYEVYGLTETGIVSWNLPGHNHPGTVGRPLFAGSVSTTDQGEIIVSSPFEVSAGYWTNGTLVSATSKGNFHTGDRGRLTADGDLVVTGRLKDVIVTDGGLKFDPSAIEEALGRRLFGWRAVVVNPPGRGVQIILAPEDGCPPREDRDLATAVTDVMSHFEPRLYATIRMFPEPLSATRGHLTRAHKVDRNAVTESILNGYGRPLSVRSGRLAEPARGEV